MDGGADGANAYVVVHPGDPEREERYPGIASNRSGSPCPGRSEREERYPGIASNIGLKPGESFSIETGGGGGVLPPADRDRDLVKGDLQDGLLTPRKAREVYGLTRRMSRRRWGKGELRANPLLTNSAA